VSATRPPRALQTGGWVNPRRLPRGPNGRALCRYCGVEVRPPRKTFCSGAQTTWHYRRHGEPRRVREPGHGCVHEHMIRSSPGYARDQVWVRDQGKCQKCGVEDPRWECDHVVPVAEGGGSCGLENLRTLCRPHHRQETAALAKRRAEARKENR
jgi:5-methylcytosine-specific restriction protein A